MKQGKGLTRRDSGTGFPEKKRRKKLPKIFGRNKRVTTFVAPKERERKLRWKEEGLKPVSENRRIHKKKPKGVSIWKKGADFLWEQKRKSSLKF